MNNKETLIAKYSDAMLDIIANIDDFTTSDLQSAISAQIAMLIAEISPRIKLTKKEIELLKQCDGKHKSIDEIIKCESCLLLLK